MVKRIISAHSQSGFTLVEVMIAMAIFAVYVTAIVLTQTTNVNDSARMAEDLKLHNLAELKMNETLIADLKFTNATENDPESGAFEIEGFKNYKYLVEFKKLELPEFEAIMGKSEEDNAQQEVDVLKKTVYTKMKKNIEKIIWQVKVTVTNSLTGAKYELNSWVNDKNARIDTNFSI